MQTDTIRRCPACGNDPDCYTEIWDNFGIEFSIDNGVIDRDGTKVPGNPMKVEATCFDCEKTWTLKGIRQINELFA